MKEFKGSLETPTGGMITSFGYSAEKITVLLLFYLIKNEQKALNSNTFLSISGLKVAGPDQRGRGDQSSVESCNAYSLP